MADALPEHVPIKDPESPTLQEGDGADDAANPAIADGDAPTGVSILRRERYEDPRDLVGEPFIRLHESQYWRWYEQLKIPIYTSTTVLLVSNFGNFGNFGNSNFQ